LWFWIFRGENAGIRWNGRCPCLTPLLGVNIIYRMSVWNKVLLLLVLFASLVFFHAALRTIKTFYYWSYKADRFETDLAKTRKDIVLLRTADHEHPLENRTFGVQQLRFDLDRMLANRGRVWTNCQKKGNVTQDAEGRVETTVTCDEGTFSGKMRLYLFEEGDELSSSKFLGEYSVKAINQSGQSNPSLVLIGTARPTQIQLKNIRDSKGQWVLYEMLPADQHELFATLPDKLREKFFPEPESGLAKSAQDEWKDKKWWLPEEFGLDGKEVDGKPYERKLRDYLEIMLFCEAERTLYEGHLRSLKRDEGFLEAAKDDSLQQEKFAEKEKAQAITDREREAKQQKAVAEYYADLHAMLKNNETAAKDQIDANVRNAQQIAKIQKEAAEQIDRRTRSMARYGAGVN
jgi:hypothetical protein